MKINKRIIILTIIFCLIASMLIYYTLGICGLLPKVLYQQCENISLETAILRGCCEDRPITHPVSWIFGESNCDKYRDEREINKKNVTKT